MPFTLILREILHKEGTEKEWENVEQFATFYAISQKLADQARIILKKSWDTRNMGYEEMGRVTPNRKETQNTEKQKPFFECKHKILTTKAPRTSAQ